MDGPSLPAACGCDAPKTYIEDGLVRCWQCGRDVIASLLPPPAKRPWTHRRTAN